ncbi:hypothetical protein JHK82_037580 [Glycine max]|uniref:Uncharacterized protein n=2 Tax=Glycine subgen. Soja TaxID=1462606 RepID=K7M2H5_SOYBN|nr:hypothetical protein JHK87_037532 [Glycine soja]KAG4971910.1 hypothetical protein JHK85_038331 [Glycine max]KAG4978305.1 hypothetical protein JHK86_037779 [Glycine max]KAG5114311.1 hypothetical protein JHK82_037580 [Glycine max]KAG5131594.1 hypothetical protein JHK84_037991 [Glycine max]
MYVGLQRCRKSCRLRSINNLKSEIKRGNFRLSLRRSHHYSTRSMLSLETSEIFFGFEIFLLLEWLIIRN